MDPVTRRMFDIRRNVLDDRGNRVFDIELPAVRTHPDDVRRAVRAKGPFELRYWVSKGERVKTGIIDLDEPSFQLVFEKGIDPDGVWELQIDATAQDGSWERELWKQSLFVQKELRFNHSVIHELASRYAPVFVFSRAERYYPVSLRTLLASPEVLECGDTMKLSTIFGKEKVPLPQLGDFMRFNGHSDYLLDFSFLSMRRSIFAAIGGDVNHATIYYSYFEDPDSDRFFINYHLIYAFDTKAGIARLSGIGPHVFDRESMVLVFEGGRQAPSSMIISGHLENQTVFLFEKLKLWTQGRIRVPYDDSRTLKLGTHPVIAVAEGSHALYPTSGVYHLSLLRELAGYLDPEVMREAAGDEQASAPQPSQILTPPSVATGELPTYRLASLGLDRLTSHFQPDAEDFDGYHSYLVFSGYWVDVPGTQNARFPPFTRKVTHIIDWVDGAYEWDWSDLPERYHQNNARIASFLRENLEDL